jgi:hypothetical protein
MTTRKVLVGIVAGLSLFGACSQATPAGPAPAATTEPSTPAASQPATSAPPSGDLAIDDFMERVVAAHHDVRTYTIDMTMQTTMSGQSMTMVMKGVVDQTDRSNINMSMDMDMGGMAMKTLKIDGAMYLQMGATGKKWMKVPKDQMAQYDTTTESADITAGMVKAKDAMKKIEKLGDEPVDGVATSHYRITIDADGLSKMTGADASISGETFAYDVWLDDADLVRKVAMDVKTDADGEKTPMTVDGVMGHYNEPVSITAPAAKDVVEMGG